MYVSHSLIPYSTGRSPVRHPGALTSGQRQAASVSDSEDIQGERIYEGELIGRKYSFDTLSGDPAGRQFTQRGTSAGVKYADHQSSGRLDVAAAYADNAGLTGADLSVVTNILDVYA